jgi:hypothetical protein
MEIIPEVSGNPEDILQAYLNGTIDHERFLLPGFRKNRFDRGNGPLVCTMNRRHRIKGKRS